jgi:hypothetical protein
MPSRASNALRTFAELNPTEAAILWLSPGPPVDRESEHESTVRVDASGIHVTFPLPEPRIPCTLVLPSKQTLLFAALLAEVYCAVSGDIDSARCDEALSTHARRLAVLRTSRGLWLTGPPDIQIELSKFASALVENGVVPQSVLARFEPPFLIERFVGAMASLERAGLILDPLVLKKILSSSVALAIFWGLVPTEFSMQTTKGAAIVSEVRVVRAPLWSYEEVQTNDVHDVKITIDAAKWTAGKLKKLADYVLEAAGETDAPPARLHDE